MIPEFDKNLPRPSRDMLEKLKNFDERIAQWEEALRNITPYHEVYNLMKPKMDRDGLIDEKSGIEGWARLLYILPDSDLHFLREKNTVLVFAMFAAISQWTEKKPVPKALEEVSMHPAVRATFMVDNVAKVDVAGEPSETTLLWEEDKMYFEGTWKETYKHLVSLIESGTARIPTFNN